MTESAAVNYGRAGRLLPPGRRLICHLPREVNASAQPADHLTYPDAAQCVLHFRAGGNNLRAI